MLFNIFCFNNIIAQPPEPQCPEEDHPEIEYENPDPILTETICYDQIMPGCAARCCYTATYYKRWIAPLEYLDIQLGVITRSSEDPNCDCIYWGRYHAKEILELLHKKILQKHAYEYNLQGRTTYPHHLTIRSACFDDGVYPPIRCESYDLGCCYLAYEVEFDNTSPPQTPQIIRYLNSYGKEYYYNTPTCQPLPIPHDCKVDCLGVYGLNLFAGFPREINKKVISDATEEFIILTDRISKLLKVKMITSSIG